MEYIFHVSMVMTIPYQPYSWAEGLKVILGKAPKMSLDVVMAMRSASVLMTLFIFLADKKIFCHKTFTQLFKKKCSQI